MTARMIETSGTLTPMAIAVVFGEDDFGTTVMEVDVGVGPADVDDTIVESGVVE